MTAHETGKVPIQPPCQRGELHVVGRFSGELKSLLVRPARQVYNVRQMLTLPEKLQITFLMLGILLLLAGGCVLIPPAAFREESLKPSGKFGVAVAATGAKEAAPWLFAGGALALAGWFAVRDRDDR